VPVVSLGPAYLPLQVFLEETKVVEAGELVVVSLLEVATEDMAVRVESGGVAGQVDS